MISITNTYLREVFERREPSGLGVKEELRGCSTRRNERTPTERNWKPTPAEQYQ